MDVLSTAWQAHTNSPRTAGPTACARCGQPDRHLTATHQVVSKTFTGYDSWQQPAGRQLCRVCTWGYRTPELRTANHLIQQHPPRLTRLTGDQLRQLLTEPVPAGVAVVVPLRPGRKHLLPTAAWGRVNVDDAQLPWTAQDAHRLTVMHRLRRAGFGTRMLTRPAPAWQVLRTLSTPDQHTVLTDWPALQVWRDRQPWLELALKATLPDAHPQAPTDNRPNTAA